MESKATNPEPESLCIKFPGSSVVDRHTHYEVTSSPVGQYYRTVTLMIRGDIAVDFYKQHKIALQNCPGLVVTLPKKYFYRNDQLEEGSRLLGFGDSHESAYIASVDEITIES